MRRIVLISCFIVLLMLAVPGLAQDGIPGNCETAPHADARNLIARFEANQSRLALVDWRTGETVRVLAEGLQGYFIRAWSPDCRYLAIAEGDTRSTDTVVYDVETGARMGSVPDASQRLHPITWGPGGYLMVETRHGAVLWHVPSGRQTILTDSFNYTRVRSFEHVVWDAAHQQVLVTLAMGGRAAFDLASGVEVTLTDEAHALLDAAKVDSASAALASRKLFLTEVRLVDPPSNSGIPNLYRHVPIPLIAEITNNVTYDLHGELTVDIEVPDHFDITHIRVDPAQEATNIRATVSSVQADGQTRTVALHDPERLLTIEHDEDDSLTRLIWVFTESIPVNDALRIGFTIVAREPGVFNIKVNASLLSRNPDEDTNGETDDDASP